MAEYDNAGFPLSYCLLTTATAIEVGKRKEALAAWAECVRDNYGVGPIFAHVDKDLGEIGALKKVWDCKISLCWWHLRRAVRTRLGKAKLATTPYNVKKACAEFDFIDADFIPPGTREDLEDYEGGVPDDAAETDANLNEANPAVLNDVTKALHIRLPPSTQPASTLVSDDLEQEKNLENTDLDDIPHENRRKIKLRNGFTLLLHPPQAADTDDTSGMQNAESEVDDFRGEGEENHTRRTFCPLEYRQSIVDMLERHYCAHPAIPGYAAPNPTAIRRWAVKQTYGYCMKNELPEVWAYLWENWYRKGRWELWARSAHDQIPVLKTTMILESQ